MGYKKPAFWKVCIAVILCTALAVCFLTNPAEANSESNNIVENQEQDLPETDYSWVWPCDNKKISVRYGERVHPVTNEISVCSHINIIGEEGDYVYAACSGVVVKAEYSSEYGNYIEIKHNEEISSQYWHLYETNVSVGQQVLPGDIIGRIGASGMATGPNLGFCLIENDIYIDPLSLYDIKLDDCYEKGEDDIGDVSADDKDDKTAVLDSAQHVDNTEITSEYSDDSVKAKDETLQYEKSEDDFSSATITESNLKVLGAEPHVDHIGIILQFPDGSIKGGYTFTKDAVIQIGDEVYSYSSGILKFKIGDPADAVDVEFSSGLISKIIVK